MKKKSLLICAFLIMGASYTSAHAQPPKLDQTYLLEQEKAFGTPFLEMRQSDALAFRDAYALGGDLFQQFIRFLFPITGREKRTQFIPNPYWGPKKPRYKKFAWERFESDHFDFYTYPEGQPSLQNAIKYFEEEYERNNRIFGVENRFEKKIPIIVYQSRRDFEQTSIVDGPIPEGLGGLTEIFGWKRVTFPFEGEKSKFEHVAKHEATHVFQIAKKVRRLPLWFIEGSAETNSIYWDSDAEMMIRDAYLNGFFFSIDQLWQIQGTWLMYKIGNYITNVIWEEYGEEGFHAIFQNANSLSFENNIKQSLGISVEELNRKVQAKLLLDYGHLLKREDIIEESIQVEERKVLLDSYGPFTVFGGAVGAQNALFLKYEKFGKKDQIIIVRDKEFENESLETFRKGVDITQEAIVYSMKRSRRDELRVQKYTYDEKKNKLALGKVSSFSWEQVDSISHPVMINANEVVFVGYFQGFPNLYKVDLKKKDIQQITTDNAHIDDLDYCPAKKLFVFSKEDDRHPKYLKYQKNIYTMDQKFRMKKITHDPNKIHLEPSFSSDCNKVLYVSNPQKTYDLFVYNVDSEIHQQITHAKIGVRNPFWGEDDVVLYNAYQKMVPSIYQTRFPTTKEVLTRRSQVSQEFLIPFTIAKNSKVSPQKPVLDGLHVFKNIPVVQQHGRAYQVESFAAVEGKIIVRSNEGLPDDDSIKKDAFAHYFEIDGQEIGSLQSDMVAKRGISNEKVGWVQSKLKGKAIIQSWTSLDQSKIFLTVNNRLANDYEEYKSEPDVAAYIYNDQDNSIQAMPRGPVSSLQQIIQWVAFLENDFLLLVVADEKKGPYYLSLYDMKNKTYSKLSEDAAQFRISSDHKKIIWKASNFMFLDVSIDELEPKKIKIDQGRIRDLAILNNGNIGFITYQKNSATWLEIQPSDMKSVVNIQYQFDEETINQAVIHPDGFIALVNQNNDKPQEQSLWLWNVKANKTFPVRTHHSTISRPINRGSYFTFIEQYKTAIPSKEFVFHINAPENLFEFDFVESSHVQLNKNWILMGKNSLALYDFEEKVCKKIANDPMGYDLVDNQLIYSEKINDTYAIKKYDLESQKKFIIQTSPNHLVKPIFDQDLVRYLEDNGGQWEVEGVEQLQGFEVIDMLQRDGQTQVFAKKEPAQPQNQPVLEETSDYPMMFLSKPSTQRIKLQTLAAAAAYDGRDLRLLLSGFADNLYGDKGVFVNSILLSDTKFVTAGYSDLENGYNTSVFYNQRHSIENYGINFTKDFILDRYRQISAYSEFEVQDYGAQASTQNGFIAPSFDSNSFYLMKVGSIYALDITSRDLHGPISGKRLYFRTELGADVERADFANFDINVDVRLYQRFLPRFGLAHRIVGGFSQGPIPNVYLMGGNMSFRGIGFDDMQGQNYWVWSEDLRIPVFDFIGVKFFDPLDGLLGFFTRYFDVRTGLYADVGSAWFNDEDMSIKYSVGYFVNVPTVFGLIVRFSDGIWGENRFNVWLGTNW